MLSFKGGQPFKCPYCDEVFANNNSELKKHMWVSDCLPMSNLMNHLQSNCLSMLKHSNSFPIKPHSTALRYGYINFMAFKGWQTSIIITLNFLIPTHYQVCLFILLQSYFFNQRVVNAVIFWDCWRERNAVHCRDY